MHTSQARSELTKHSHGGRDGEPRTNGDDFGGGVLSAASSALGSRMTVVAWRSAAH
jgi:hypothetical protein